MTTTAHAVTTPVVLTPEEWGSPVTHSTRYGGSSAWSRELTDNEKTQLRRAHEQYVPVPPWTPLKITLNQSFTDLIVNLHIDGVGVQTLAKAVDWPATRLNQVLIRARRSGREASPRRLLTPPEPVVVEPPEISAEDTDKLRELFGSTTGRFPKLQGLEYQRAAQAFVELVTRLRADGFSIQTIASTVGASKQAVSARIKSRTQTFPTGFPRPLTTRETNDIVKRFDAMPLSQVGEHRWSSEFGVNLLDELQRLVDDNVPVSAIAEALDQPASVVGRMLAMREPFRAKLSA